MKHWILISCLVLAVGCSSPQTKTESPQPKPNEPVATNPGEPKPDFDSKKEEARYLEVKKAYDENPKDPHLKETYVAELVVYGTIVMQDPNLGPKDKYPHSLKLFREAAKLDPSNQDAKDNIALIEGIYKDMGRPIPN